MKTTLYGGPFDGLEYNGPVVQFLEYKATATALPNTVLPTGEPPASLTHVRYNYRADTNRYTWEGLRDGR